MSEAGRLRERLVAELRREGVVEDAALARAFANVPRELFVPGGFRRRDGSWVAADDADFLDTVYDNDVLVTKVDDGLPVSSSSQPSLMALMLSALRLRPGLRVLEIGAGTGYNAALMQALGARVTTVDVQPDVVRSARAALRRAGVPEVEVLHGDGYLGHPGGAPYDRVVVTVGVAGISPHWLDQLNPDGFLLAPVRHAGHHPVLWVTRDRAGPVRAGVVCPAGFMSATGPLGARHPWAHPPAPPAGTVARPRRCAPARWQPPLPTLRYHDLWFAVGAWDRRATLAGLDGPGRAGGCALVDDAGGEPVLAYLAPDGAVWAVGAADALVADATDLLDRWEAAGGPTITDWRAVLTPTDADQPIWVPHDWHCA